MFKHEEEEVRFQRRTIGAKSVSFNEYTVKAEGEEQDLDQVRRLTVQIEY